MIDRTYPGEIFGHRFENVSMVDVVTLGHRRGLLLPVQRKIQLLFGQRRQRRPDLRLCRLERLQFQTNEPQLHNELIIRSKYLPFGLVGPIRGCSCSPFPLPVVLLVVRLVSLPV